MGKERLAEFDYIRVVSLVGILVCHSLLDYWTSYEWLGRLFGMTFNFLFLILSAFLFGMSWEAKGYPVENGDFLKKRMYKLSRSYYPYLALLFLLLYLSEGFFSIRKIASHALYLPWFDKIEGYGHLWFMTMIMLCYVGCLVVTRESFRNLSVRVWLIMIVASIPLDYVVSIKGLPGYIFPYLIGYLFVLRYSRKILELVRRIGTVANIVQFISVVTLNYIVFSCYKLDPYSFMSYFMGILQAISVFCFMYNMLRNASGSRIVVFISGISFEVYLVHEFFLGHHSVYRYFNEPVLSVIMFVALSVLTGYLLHLISNALARRC
ncbi:MAG: acyltransferase [Bacteroidales bacterium]|nr:acyltransferase [Bacteroidales bacterium]